MRIIQVINSLGTGGAERLAQDLHGQYRLDGHDSTILLLSGNDSGWVSHFVYSLGLGSPYDPKSLPMLSDLPAEVGLDFADVIHVHLFPAQSIMAMYRESSNAAGCLITSEHSTSNRRRATCWGGLMDRWTYSAYDRIICVSKAAATELGRWIPGSSKLIEVISNGVDLSRFTPLPELPVRARKSPPVIFSAGRLIEAKNYTAAINAVAILQRTGVECLYRIAGDGPLKEILTGVAADLGVSSTVEFLGEVSDVPFQMRQADVFLMPSLREGFGIAAVEAMACGLPVVASDVPALGDVIGRDRSCGILADPESPRELAEALHAVLNDHSLSESMGRCGASRAAQFSIERTAAEHLRLFGEVLREKRGGLS